MSRIGGKDDEDDGRSMYSIKFPRRFVIFNSFKSKQGAADLAIEALTLSSINHRNIIKLHGIACGGISAFESSGKISFFLVLDRLKENLGERLKTWSDTYKQVKKSKVLDCSNSSIQKTSMFACRLRVALDVASAMEYLHKNNIIYRDLKPENIGFDMNGETKLFDFGLARELSSHLMTPDGTYKMSFCGSRIYAAPEMVLHKPYNLSADVYSFGIMLWEICGLKRAFRDLNSEMHHRLVVKMGNRPEIEEEWPKCAKNVMMECWSDDYRKRPDFESIVETLKCEASKHFVLNDSMR